MLVATLLGYLGVFGVWFYPGIETTPLVDVTATLVIYNQLHVSWTLLDPASLVPFLALGIGGYHLAKSGRSGFRGGATVAVGYVGAAAFAEVVVILLSVVLYSAIGLRLGDAAVRVVAAGMVAVVLGGLGGVVYDRRRGITRGGSEHVGDSRRETEPAFPGTDDGDSGRRSDDGDGESPEFVSRNDRDDRR